MNRIILIFLLNIFCCKNVFSQISNTHLISISSTYNDLDTHETIKINGVGFLIVEKVEKLFGISSESIYYLVTASHVSGGSNLTINGNKIDSDDILNRQTDLYYDLDIIKLKKPVGTPLLELTNYSSGHHDFFLKPIQSHVLNTLKNGSIKSVCDKYNNESLLLSELPNINSALKGRNYMQESIKESDDLRKNCISHTPYNFEIFSPIQIVPGYSGSPAWISNSGYISFEGVATHYNKAMNGSFFASRRLVKHLIAKMKWPNLKIENSDLGQWELKSCHLFRKFENGTQEIDKVISSPVGGHDSGDGGGHDSGDGGLCSTITINRDSSGQVSKPGLIINNQPAVAFSIGIHSPISAGSNSLGMLDKRNLSFYKKLQDELPIKNEESFQINIISPDTSLTDLFLRKFMSGLSFNKLSMPTYKQNFLSQGSDLASQLQYSQDYLNIELNISDFVDQNIHNSPTINLKIFSSGLIVDQFANKYSYTGQIQLNIFGQKIDLNLSPLFFVDYLQLVRKANDSDGVVEYNWNAPDLYQIDKEYFKGPSLQISRPSDGKTKTIWFNSY